MSSPELIPTKKEKIIAIIDDIFKLDSPKIDESRKNQVSDFIMSAVNGDNLAAHLVLNANLSENNKGAIIFILTNLRLIKIDIANKEIQSSSFFLNTLIGIDRKLIDGERSEFSIAFQNGSFGLRYSQDNQNITDFFQKIDRTRMS